MNFLITLIILCLVLGIIVFIHEFGHFIAAKRLGVCVSEFAIGMGPKIFKFKKGETTYSLGLLPIGGYNAIQMTEKENPKTKKERVFENKSFLGKLYILLNGIFFNLILAIVFLFINGIFYGSPDTRALVGDVVIDSPSYNAGLIKGDVITEINGKTVKSWDEALIILQYGDKTKKYEFTVLRDNEYKKLTIVPEITKDEEGKNTNYFGFGTSTYKKHGFVNAIKYCFTGTYKMIESLVIILGNLFTGKIGLNNLSGPVGVFTVIDTLKETGLENIIYLVSYLSLNVGIINLLPVPVFDGGRVLLVIIEKIKGKKVNPKLEEWLNTIGFILLLILMIYVTLNDVLKLF